MVPKSIGCPQCPDSGRLILVKGLGLINKHYGDIVANLIDKFAGIADKAIVFLIEFNLSLALGAGDNVEQFLFDHDLISVEFETPLSQGFPD